MSVNPAIHIVDDETRLLNSLLITLRSNGFEHVRAFAAGSDFCDALPGSDCAVALLDLFLPDMPGMEILERIQGEFPHVVVVVITGVDETETAVRCMRAGAFDYLVKPVQPERLITTVQRAFNHAVVLRQNITLRQRLLAGGLDHPEAFAAILTADPKLHAIFQYLEVVAPAADPVLITGETGTGKDLTATALHAASGREGPLVSLNVAGLDDNMFADTLFGHVKGAFTTAASHRPGLIQQAKAGTLFLDEIGDLSLPSQVKLLKLIQDREYYPLGADRPSRCTARIVAATNQNLRQCQQEGRFRGDLFYRMSTYHVQLPPLRERGEDVLLLTRHYLRQARAEFGVEHSQDRVHQETLSPRLSAMLRAYPFPGNVRELRSLIFDAVAQGGLDILEDKMARLVPSMTSSPSPRHERPEFSFPETLPTLDQLTRNLIQEALDRTKGNQAAAARMLGISRQALHKRLARM